MNKQERNTKAKKANLRQNFRESGSLGANNDDISINPFVELGVFALFGVVAAVMLQQSDYVFGIIGLRLFGAYSNFDEHNPKIVGLFPNDKINDFCVVLGVCILLTLGLKAFKFI